MNKYIKHIQLLCLLCLLFTICSSAKRSKRTKLRELSLTSIHIIDRNGFTETISNKERLNQFQNADFLSQQPYQKVLRIYARDSKGNIRSVVNTYHENGNPKQFLEVINARANGTYCEWHENGRMSLMTKVIGGIADVTAVAEKSWLFDGACLAWDENEAQVAAVHYEQGSLEDTTFYFHSNGQIWKRIPYSKNEIEGTLQIYRSNGELFQETNYSRGAQNGSSIRYWDCDHLASVEDYCRGKLLNGQYFNKQGELVGEVKEGTGSRIVFGKETIQEVQQFVDGLLEGEVKVLNGEGVTKRVYHVKNGIKHGEETEYYERFFVSAAPLTPRLSFNWHEGKVQGIVRSWYPDGTLESQKEMTNNTRHGLLTSWYRDGNLMMIEQYESGKLVKGDYFRREEKNPASQVIKGEGTATIFDAEGHLLQKITYEHGKPQV